MAAHAKYGGSTAARTEECPSWVAFCEVNGLKSQDSEYADRGTLCHNAMEKIYSPPPEGEEPIDPKSVIGMMYEGIELDQALYDEKIVPAIRAVEEILTHYCVETIELEALVTIADDAWGTSDLLGKGEFIAEANDAKGSLRLKVAITLDYKFGDGIPVRAEGNRQLRFYSAGAETTPGVADLFEGIDVLALAIVQPNDRGADDYTVEEIDPREMAEFRASFMECVEESEDILTRAILADANEGEDILEFFNKEPFDTGDHCQFCPARGLCPATSGAVQTLARLDLTAPNLIEMLPTFKELERFEKTAKAIRKLVQAQLEAGAVILDYKLVPKRARHAYIDAEATEAVIKRSRKIKKADAYDSILKSPAQLEKMCKRLDLDYEKMFAPFIDSISSGTTLTGADDPRVALPGMAELSALLERD